MAELPGWDRHRLRTADPVDVEAARLIAFTRSVRPLLERDIDHEITQLMRADMKPEARERLEKTDRARAREGLRQLAKDQASLRRFLLLDETDDD